MARSGLKNRTFTRAEERVGRPLARFTRTPLRSTLRLLGLLLILFSTTMLPPVLVGCWYGDGAVMPFLLTFTLTMGTGLACWLPVRRGSLRELHHRDGFTVVVVFWFSLSLLSALPFMLAEHPHMHLVDAVFEATSGLTTTGATILIGLDQLPRAIVYYRAQLNFLGGMGIIVLAIALLPMLSIGGMQLYRAETPGPMKEEKLTPRIAETAKKLWYVYVSLVIACALSFWLAGMSPFDAIAHSFATLALGGFSTHDASIGYFQSPAIELIAGVFSLLAGINFALHFMAWRSRSLKTILGDPEFQCYCVVMGLVILTVCAALYLSKTFPLWESIYHGFFQAASITTDNGLVTAGYPGWPWFIALLLVMASFFGGCAGSTCGAIKAIRFLLLYRQSLREIRKLIHPSAEIPVKVGHRAMSERVVEAVWGFYFLYILSYCVFSLALVATGVDLVTAFGSVAACLNNMGAGLGETGATFGSLNDTATWLLSLSMIVGRLEVFPLLVLFLPEFWR